MRHIGKALLLLAFIAYPILLHVFILKQEEVELWQLLFVFSPLLAVGGWIVLRMVARKWWPLLLLLFAGIGYALVSGSYGRVGLLAVNGFSHATLNLFLLWVFGRTLLRGREPLISQISRRVNGELLPEVVLYTRHVTYAWCAFFLMQVLVSFTLYTATSLALWSFFINVMNLPLLALMFVVEKTYRNIAYPNHPRTSILKAIEVYSKDFAGPKKADSRH